MKQIANRYLPYPRILHPWPEQRFLVTHPSAFLVVLAPLIWVAVLHFALGLEPLNRLITFGRFAIASLVLLLALVLAHRFLPAGQRSLRDISPGILLTSAMGIAAGIAFGSFLAEFARNYVTTYAGLASVMIALVFLYMIASISSSEVN